MIGNCCHDFGVYYGLGWWWPCCSSCCPELENWSSSKNNWVRMQMTWPLEHVPCGIANEHLEDSSSFLTSSQLLWGFLGRKIEMTLATLLCSRNTASADLAKQFFFTLQVRWWNLSWNHFVIITTVLTKDHLLLQSVSSKSMQKCSDRSLVSIEEVWKVVLLIHF